MYASDSERFCSHCPIASLLSRVPTRRALLLRIQMGCGGNPTFVLDVLIPVHKKRKNKLKNFKKEKYLYN